METAGLIVGVAGLAGLFNSCLEAVDKVQSYLTFGTDSHALDTRFKTTKVRFERWGPAVGIKQGKLSEDHHSALDNDDVSTAVRDLLHNIKLICDASDASSAPGRRTRAIGPGNAGSSGSQRQHPPHSATSESKRCKLVWALWGKTGRTEQVELFEKLVQGLHDLVPWDNTEQSTRPLHEPGARRTDTLALGTRIATFGLRLRSN
jgi:hypothetical protein